MKLVIKYLFIASLVIAAAPVFAAEAATLYFSPVQSNYSPGQIVKLNVIVNPNGSTYDTVGADISFSPDVLQVQSVAINPVFSQSSPDNSFSNSAGTISYGAGIPGGSSQTANFATVTFSVKQAGNASVSLRPSSLILKGGENIFTGSGSSASFTVTNPTVPKKPDPVPVAKSSLPSNTRAVPSTAALIEAEKENPTGEVAQASDRNTATAALEPSVVPLANEIAGNGVNYLKLILPILLVILAAGIGFALYRRYEKV